MKEKSLIFVFLILVAFISSCSTSTNQNSQSNNSSQEAKIVSVVNSGNENNYIFSVGISSPDKGCEQYANWWEVISEDGNLIYRRILEHSHVNEQPFIRSGGKVNIKKNQIVLIRVHMNTTGYSQNTYKGSVNDGFIAFKVESNFANNLANKKPLPTGCAF